MKKGVNNTPRGQSSHMGANFTPYEKTHVVYKTGLNMIKTYEKRISQQLFAKNIS
jgi:hypothetical protein